MVNSSSIPVVDSPPGTNELELTIFGPGIGECVLVHLGNGDWFVIDSCVYPKGKSPVALEYLQAMGVDPAKSIRRILATHWHDDHIRGIAQLLKACPDAGFIMSGALQGDQFFRLVLEVNASNRLVSGSSSAQEFADVLEILESRTSPAAIASPCMYAQDGSRLYAGGYRGTSEVWSLSPSASTITNAMKTLASKLVTPGKSKRFRPHSPNDVSVATLVRAGSWNLLLGADLENTVEPEFGWRAVLSSTARPTDVSQVFKVGHHGSQNAHHDDIWNTMLSSDPTSVITPYTRLSDKLPTTTDVSRIQARTKSLYCTTWPPSRKPTKRRAVDGIIAGAAKSRHALNTDRGYVRVRVDLSASTAVPSVELFGSAAQL